LWLTIITTPPVFWRVSTYFVASIICSSGKVLSIIALYFPSSISFLKKMMSPFVSFGVGFVFFYYEELRGCRIVCEQQPSFGFFV